MRKKLDTEPTGASPKSLLERFHTGTNVAYERVTKIAGGDALDRARLPQRDTAEPGT